MKKHALQKEELKGVFETKHLSNKTKSSKLSLIIILIALAVVIVLFIISLPTNCKDNGDCFLEKSKVCKKAKVSLENDGDIMSYLIRGKKQDTCVLKITKEKVSDLKSTSLKKALEGREMDCAIPMEILQNTDIRELNNINDYCTGTLKEAVLEISLQKMYELIVKDLGNITTTLNEVVQALDK